MKRLLLLALLSVVLTGCVKQEDYDALAKKNEKLQQKVEDLEEENDDLRAEIKQLKEKPTETISEASPTPNSNSENTLMELYNKTFTNPESQSSISFTVYYNNGEIQLMSDYQMPSHSYFDTDYQAEASAGLYCAYILTMVETCSYTTATCNSNEYYNSIISTAANDDGYIFLTNSRNGNVAYTKNDRDWYEDYMANMTNDRYSSSELGWVSDTFTTFANEFETAVDQMGE